MFSLLWQRAQVVRCKVGWLSISSSCSVPRDSWEADIYKHSPGLHCVFHHHLPIDSIHLAIYRTHILCSPSQKIYVLCIQVYCCKSLMAILEAILCLVLTLSEKTFAMVNFPGLLLLCPCAVVLMHKYIWGKAWTKCKPSDYAPSPPRGRHRILARSSWGHSQLCFISAAISSRVDALVSSHSPGATLAYGEKEEELRQGNF